MMTRQRRLAAVKALSLASRVNAAEPPWEPARLQAELQKALSELQCTTVDLLESWDGDKSGCLSKKEWLVQWKRLMGLPEGLWYSHVREAVVDAFDEIDIGAEGALEVNEVDSWLQHGGRRSRSPTGAHTRRRPTPQLVKKASAARRSRHHDRASWTMISSSELAWGREEKLMASLLEQSRRLRTSSPPTSPRANKYDRKTPPSSRKAVTHCSPHPMIDN